ncbi:MAG: phosphoadenosine phosphosulfate reductase family protein [Prevotellaceae bacterium]|jgi:3'-phosphoadenosine 5'-phosphosulfate sulfotransferase (PAPS reductase)/FAD synthetase|nr:phosphoadenosine phosphosulfate reductase family protein [Prevotellaceae bacterium]
MSASAAAGIIHRVASVTDRVILFHSAAGKGSIVLLDMLSAQFREVLCVFMYLIKDSYLDRYIAWAERKYPNARFVKIPHFQLSVMVKNGSFGVKPNPKQKVYNLSMLANKMCAEHGVAWCCFGFKQSDSLNRRLMLRTYEMGGVNEKTRRFYPLSEWKNGDCLAYIKRHQLATPIRYSTEQSADMDIGSGAYLTWCRQNHPKDFEKIVAAFPLCGALQHDYEQREKQNEKQREKQGKGRRKGKVPSE